MKNKDKKELNALGQTFGEALEAMKVPTGLEAIKISELIDVSSWKEKQEKLVAENPFFEITDNKTYEAGKKHRTNVVKGRTELQNQEKLVASTFATIRKEVGSETAVLIQITQPLENQWQEAVKAWEDRKEREKQEAKEAEELRIKTIKDKIDEIESSCHEIIQKMVFSEIDFSKTQLFAFFTIDFDFEEYDILFEQVKSRVESALETKIASLTTAENQRLDNIRLEEANKEAKRLSDLQASRLNEILLYVAFGEAVDLTKLSELEDEAYSEILASKKALFEADAKEKKEAQDKLDAENLERKQKAKADKEKMFEIRKGRLAEIGLNPFEDESCFVYELRGYNFFYSYVKSFEDINNSDIIEFENIISDAKKCISDAEERLKDKKIKEEEAAKELEEQELAKEKETKSRVVKLLEAGLKHSEEHDTYFVAADCDFILLIEDVSNESPEEFEETLYAVKQAIFDYQKSKEDAENLKKENKARVKRLAGDKELLSNIIDAELSVCLDCNYENKEILEFVETAKTRIAVFKKELLTELEKL